MRPCIISANIANYVATYIYRFLSIHYVFCIYINHVLSHCV